MVKLIFLRPCHQNFFKTAKNFYLNVSCPQSSPEKLVWVLRSIIVDPTSNPIHIFTCLVLSLDVLDGHMIEDYNNYYCTPTN